MSRLFPSRKWTGAVALVGAMLLGAAMAYAADALIIEPDGTIKIENRLNFGNRKAELITLWSPDYAIGIQSATLYSRSAKNFAWYTGGKHDDAELNAGGGAKAMSLTGGTLAVSGSFEGMGAVPRGAILMWSGNPAQLPKGWVLCDSQNGTPDLRSRFIVGYDPRHADNKTMRKTGGEDLHALTMAEMPSHNHGQAGNHRHSFSATDGGWAFNIGRRGDPRRSDKGTVYTSTNGAHTHASEGGGAPHENRPPYYVLAYIMYTGK